MQTLPDLNQLSHAEKDELIRLLWSMVQGQAKQLAALQVQVAELQSRLNKNSRNSSKPPSSDGLRKPAPKSLRVAGQRPSGGQPDHPGTTLSQVAQPDHTVVHGVDSLCGVCGCEMGSAYVAQKRQVFDLPAVRYEVTEHQAMQAVCGCGHVHTAQFPAGVNASVQYGPRVQAAMVHLNQNHAVSVQRTAALIQDFFGLAVSEAAVIKATRAGAETLEPTVQEIGLAIIRAQTAHADESGMRVANKLHWLHVLATDTLTWMALHPKRGFEAFESLGLLQQFRGVLVHDGLLAYKALACEHALCNQHHLRELTHLLEEQGLAWAGDIIHVLTHANHLDNLNCAQGRTPDYASEAYQREVQELRDLYTAILAHAQTEHPIAASTGKRGRVKQSAATNLIRRLLAYSDEVWRFMTQPNVPFTNNLAEQTVRMPKVKQKVSGCFRTTRGGDDYCTIRSYCATMIKQGANIFESLVSAFQGAPPQPRLA